MPQYDEDDYGLGVYGEESSPVVTKRLINYFPTLFKRENKDGSPSTFTKYVNTYDLEIQKFDADLDHIRQSRQIDNASKSDLDKIGSKFGELGRRGGRSDKEYRTYLKGIFQSFSGRGTKPGLKYAVASAVNTDTESVVVIEDFENNEYELRIEDTEVGFLSSVVNDVAELADPSGVSLASPPVIQLEGADVRITASESKVIESESGLGSDAVTLDGSWTLK